MSEENEKAEGTAENTAAESTNTDSGESKAEGGVTEYSPSELSAEDLLEISDASKKQDGDEKPAEDAKDDAEDTEEGEASEEGGEDKKDVEDGEKAPEGWDEDTSEWLKSKGWDIKHDESAAKYVQSHRELEKTFHETSKTNSQYGGYLKDVTSMLQNGDVAGLKSLAQSMGGDLPVGATTDEDQIKEISGGYDRVYDQFNPIMDSIDKTIAQINQMGEISPAQAVGVLQKINGLMDGKLVGMQDEAKGKITKLETKKEIRESTRSALGLPKTSQSPVYDQWANQAKEAHAEFRKHDKNADAAIDAVKSLLVSSEQGKQTPFEAAGLNLAKAFGHSWPMAQEWYNIGKALVLHEQFKSGDLEKSIIDKYKKELGQGGKSQPPGKAGQKPPQQANTNKVWQNEVNEYMGV